MAKKVINAFNGGEVDPKLHARSDVKRYDNSCLKMENFVPIPFGGATRRPASKFIIDTGNTEVRIFSYIISDTDKYILEFSNLKLRILKNDAILQKNSVDIEITTPYTTAQLKNIHFAQSYDILYFAHPNHSPQKLKHYSDTHWEWEELNFEFDPMLDINVEDIKITHSTNDQNAIVVLESTDDMFRSNHVGAIFSLRNKRTFAQQKVEGIGINQGQGLTGISNSINVSFQNYTITSVQGAVELYLQRSTDGGVTFEDFALIGDSFSQDITNASETFSFTYSSPEAENANTYIRLRYLFADKGSNFDDNNTLRFTIQPEYNYVTSLYKITEYVSNFKVKATVESKAEILGDNQTLWEDSYKTTTTAFTKGNGVKSIGLINYDLTGDVNNFLDFETNQTDLYAAGSTYYNGSHYLISKRSNEFFIKKYTITWDDTTSNDHSFSLTEYNITNASNVTDYSISGIDVGHALYNIVEVCNIMFKDGLPYVLFQTANSFVIAKFNSAFTEFSVVSSIAEDDVFADYNAAKGSTIAPRETFQSAVGFFDHIDDRVYVSFVPHTPSDMNFTESYNITKPDGTTVNGFSISGINTSHRAAIIYSYPDEILTDAGQLAGATGNDYLESLRDWTDSSNIKRHSNPYFSDFDFDTHFNFTSRDNSFGREGGTAYKHVEGENTYIYFASSIVNALGVAYGIEHRRILLGNDYTFTDTTASYSIKVNEYLPSEVALNDYTTGHPNIQQSIWHDNILESGVPELAYGETVTFDGKNTYIWILDDTDVNNKKTGIWRYPVETGTRYYSIIKDFPATNSGGFLFKSLLDDAYLSNADVNTKQWSEGAFSGYRGYPSAVGFYERRLCFSGQANLPNYIFLSKTDDFTNYFTDVKDTDAMRIRLFSGKTDAIKWILPEKSLILGTTSAEFALGSNRDDIAITPSAFSLKQKSAYGSSSIDPFIAKDNIFFFMRDGKNLREWSFEYNTKNATSNDLSYIANHLLKSGVKDVTYQQQRNSIIWVVTNDGDLVGLTYEKEYETLAWHKHTFDGTVESVAILSEENQEDSIYLSIKDSNNNRNIVKLDPLDWGTDYTTEFAGLDFYKKYTGFDKTTLTGLDYLEGKTVTVLDGGLKLSSTYTVTSGSITIPSTNNTVYVGLPYTATLAPLYLDADGSMGSKKSVHHATIRFKDTLGAKVGQKETGTYGENSVSVLDDVKFSSTTTLNTEDAEVWLANHNEFLQTIYIVSDSPQPCTVLAMVVDVEGV